MEVQENGTNNVVATPPDSESKPLPAADIEEKQETEQPAPKPNGAEAADQEGALIEELVRKYAAEETGLVGKADVARLAEDYAATVQAERGDVIQALETLCTLMSVTRLVPSVEAFTADQIKQALRPSPGPEEQTPTLAPAIEEPPHPLPFELDLAPALQTVPISDLQPHSAFVVKSKLHRHASAVSDILSKSVAASRSPVETMQELLLSLSLLLVRSAAPDQQPTLGRPRVRCEIPAESLAAVSHELELEDGLLGLVKQGYLAVDANNELGIEYKAGTQKPGFVDTLRQTIGMYESLLLRQKLQGMDTAHTETLLATLRKQLGECVKGAPMKRDSDNRSVMMSVRSSVSRRSMLTPKERRIKALDEIFHFYTKQCALAHVRKTFETVETEMNTMGLGYFIKFMKDFSISINAKVQPQEGTGRGRK